jgi:hypothetical protein
MIRVLLGRFFRHCIERANNPRRVVVRQLEPDFMTDAEISHFIHGRVDRIDWNQVAIRKRAGHVIRPRHVTAAMEVLP